MQPHDVLALYDAKAVEYLIAIAFLVLFVPFWRYVDARLPAREAVPALSLPRAATGWFQLPEGLHLHPGHSWARVEPDGRVTVGLDDFGHRLVGPLDAVRLPAAGAELRQGSPALGLEAQAKHIDVLAPLDGTVEEVNPNAASDPASLHRDPYGEGWLLRLKPHRLGSDLKQLLDPQLARLWLERSGERLRERFSPALGALAADGGTPIHGFARELDPERWDALVREFLLTNDVDGGRS